jgi:tetratricopeptide (TPR) repeat protein
MISRSDIARLKTKAAVLDFIDRRCGGDPEKLVGEINSTLNQLLYADLKKAGRFLEQVRACARHFPKKMRFRFLAMEARYAHWTGKSHLAGRIYQRSIAGAVAARNHNAAARARMGLMDVLSYLGRHREALDEGQRALRYFLRRKDIRAAGAMTNIGNIYHRLDQNTMALRYYDRAREAYAGTGDANLAIVDYNRANVFANFNQLDKAAELYRSAAEVYRRHDQSLAAAKAEYSLSYLYFLEGRYTEALSALEQILEVFRRLGDKKLAAVTQLDLAEINTYLNQYSSTLLIGRRILTDFRRYGSRYEQAKAAFFVAEAFLQLGDTSEAARYLRYAQRLFERENNLLWQGMVNLVWCRLKMATDRPAEALDVAVTARRLFSRSGDARRRTDAEIAIAEAYRRSGQGERFIRMSRDLLKQPLVGYQKYRLHDLIGRHYLDGNQYGRALSEFTKAIGIIELMLIHLYPDEIRFFFAVDKYPTYLAAAECLLKQGQPEQSFLQHSRALAVLNQRRLPESTLQHQVPPHLLETRAALRASLKKLNRISDTNTDQRGVSLTGGLRRTEHQLWAQERKIRSYLYPAGEAQGLPKAEAHAYSRLIAADETVINFVATGQSVGAFVVGSGATVYTTCPVTPGRLEETVRELHFLMEKAVYAPGKGDAPAIARRYLQRLHEWLLGPLAPAQQTRRLIFLVDGVFAQIPYPALVDGAGNWLKDRFDIRVIVNPDDLASDRTAHLRMDDKQCAVFAAGTAEMPMVETEGVRIAGIFPHVRRYAGDQATGSALKVELANADGFVHIAAHAARSSENPLFSQILLSDGPFFPFDLFGMGIKAQLVSLSGCQTAAPGIYYGNSFSLAKIFYQGGARFVLASLWPVSDKVSMVFMVEFYHALHEAADIAAAYAAAMRKVMTLNENPAFWAPFVLVGI